MLTNTIQLSDNEGLIKIMPVGTALAMWIKLITAKNDGEHVLAFSSGK